MNVPGVEVLLLLLALMGILGEIFRGPLPTGRMLCVTDEETEALPTD